MPFSISVLKYWFTSRECSITFCELHKSYTGRKGEKTMTGKIRFWQGLALLLLLLTAGCAGTVSTPYPDEVDWATAVEILNTGEVDMVIQLHSLDVTLTMKDGSEIHTVEPTIDAIFAEIEKCGRPCSQIAVATE